jgi:hypothetical protein
VVVENPTAVRAPRGRIVAGFDVGRMRDRELVGQIHAIKHRVLSSGKVSFDAERTNRGHADKFWTVARACQRERMTGKARNVEVGLG